MCVIITYIVGEHYAILDFRYDDNELGYCYCPLKVV